MYLIYRVVMTIEAICDRCGREITLKYCELGGVEEPSGWRLITQLNPLKRDYDYRTFCPECKAKIWPKKAEE